MTCRLQRFKQYCHNISGIKKQYMQSICDENINTNTFLSVADAWPRGARITQDPFWNM